MRHHGRVAAVGDREYRSIGETLDFIKEEFPEVTISKIRFLETQGLIAPERTTNGYRKFYDHDIERLTFVLRQQREQFLPLKVIKDRITEKEPGVFVLDPSKGRFAKYQRSKSSKFEKDIFGDPLVEIEHQAHRKQVNHKVEAKGSSNPDTGSISTGTGRIERSSPAGPPESRNTASANSRLESKSSETAAPNVKSQHAISSDANVSAAQGDPPVEKPISAKRPRLFALPSASALAEKLDEARALHNGSEETDDSLESANDAAESVFPKNSFTAREIAELADLSLVQVEELTTFGLLNPTSVRGQQIYCAADLELASLAREFAKFGLEARHLKMYRVSAEREASFLEQVILPILANKSPKSRNRAETALTQLGELGAQFRTLLLERAIEKILKS
ncbi:MAG: MerR family transcriptional regulator [Actinomycetota bacterium]|nr:MAG: MerR family transcriptional regulator [Actinomycetota bacterium]